MISTSGRAALTRRPSSSNEAVSQSRVGELNLSQSRAISGPWLAAKAPTSSAMLGLLQRVQTRQQIRLAHAADTEIEAQQIGVRVAHQYGHIIREDRGADFGPKRIAVENWAAILPPRRHVVGIPAQIEHHSAEPVI